MTIETLNTFSGPYTGTGAEGQEFAVTFQSAGVDEIEVLLDGEAVSTSLWSFARDDDGRGTVTATLDGEVYIQSAPGFAQEADFQRFGPYFPNDFNPPLDRAAIRDQYLKDRLDRAPVAPRDGSWNGLFPTPDGSGNWIAASGIGSDGALRADLAAADGSGAALISFQQGGAGPTILRDLRARSREFLLASDKCALDGINDDSAGFWPFAEWVSSTGGGMVWLPPGRILTLDYMKNLPTKVRLNLNEGQLIQRLSAGANNFGVDSGIDPGLRLLSGCGIENGTVRMISDPAGLGSQGAQHACLVAGPLYGEGGTAASPSALHETEDFFIRDITFISNAANKPCIQLMGGVHDFEIDHVMVGDNDDISGVVFMDWGTVGPVDTSGNTAAEKAAAIQATRDAFDDDLAYTLSPRGGTVSRVEAGRLTQTGSCIVRLSCVNNIRVSTVYAVEADGGASGAAILVTGGDVGREFMREQDVADAMKNIVIEGVHIPDCGIGYAVRADARGDNIQAAVDEGYVPLHDPVVETNLIVRDSTFVADASSDVLDGATISYMTGGTFVNCTFRGFRNGVLLDNGCRSVLVDRCTTIYSREHGQCATGVTAKPANCTFRNPISYFNGLAESGPDLYAQVALLVASRCTVDGGALGNPTGGDENASYGIMLAAVADGGDNNQIIGEPLIHSHKAGGAAVTIGTTESYGCCELFTGARYGDGVTVRYDTTDDRGLAIVPYQTILGDLKYFAADSTQLPSGGEPPATFPGKRGMRIILTDPVSEGYEGSRCVADGTPGDWELYGVSLV